MSDLAPFVADILRDKTVSDLQQELAAEKEKNKKLQEELRVIRVTGPGGFPVYAERHYQYYKLDQYSEYDEYDLMLQNSTDGGIYDIGPRANPKLASCPIQDVDQCELHIGGKEIFVLGDYNDSDTLAGVGDRDCNLLYIYRRGRHDKIKLSFLFGPNPTPNSTTAVDPEDCRNEDIEFVRFSYVSFTKHPFGEVNPPPT